jgi:hypothetical protein
MFICNLSILKYKRKIARTLFLIMMFQIVSPVASFALTGGPSQPEFQQFTPVGATDMVDLFTGDFSYNIPLMDVDGYPINMSYHNVSNADEESSWLGLGWNINLGEVSRTVRGLPDDFNGDEIQKYMHVLPEKDNRIDLGLKLEIFGVNTSKIMKLIKAIAGKNGSGSGKLGLYYGWNNYYGQYGGVSLGLGIGGQGKIGGLSTGINMDFSSNEGADLGVSCNYSYSATNQHKLQYGMGVGMNHGYNTRNGYKDPSINATLSVTDKNKYVVNKHDVKDPDDDKTIYREAGTNFSGAITPGLINYIPTMTNPSNSDAYTFGLSVSGIKIEGGLWGTITGSFAHSVTNTDELVNNKGYGYLYLGNSHPDDLMDFTRDNGGTFNKNMPNLPMSAMTYDIYNVNAQGTGGSFRPFRNDLGVIHDPAIKAPNLSDNFGLSAEIGMGTLAELGTDLNYTNVKYEAGLIPNDEKKKLPNGSNLFSDEFHPGDQKFNGLYEPYYFKKQGEYSSNNVFNTSIGDTNIYSGNGGIKNRNAGKREPRASMVYFYNTGDTKNDDVTFVKKIENYTDANGLKNGMSTSKTLLGKDNNNRGASQISEIVQVSTTGERYVFGIPAMNNISKDISMGLDQGVSANYYTGICQASGITNSTIGGGRDKLYTYTKTPAHAHSFLLSAILSSDYIDVNNDGITDDDLGNYVKFNYSRSDSDYRWRTPYSNNGNDAYFEAGYHVDAKDNRASYSIGSKELWYAHSIETKNMVAEFYTSTKEDGKGTSEAISTTSFAALSSKGSTRKLDSLKLYNKNDRFLKGDNAVPIKTIYFEYDYQLCQNTPNSDNTNKGKLTLKRVYTKFGNSDKSLLSPYQFSYSSFNPDYNSATKNRWGTYQPIDSTTPNYLYPYVRQSVPKDSADKYASAWQLTKIKLPTGGEINVTYESDDYAFVQNKRAAEMTKVVGMGSSSSFASSSSELYKNKDNSNDYIFVKKRGSNYFSSDLNKVFLDNEKLIYFNFAVDIVHRNYNDRDNYDEVKGFAEVEGVGICPDDTNYLYIHIGEKKLEKGKLKVNPITYAGINIGRRDLTHFLYPGGDDPGFKEMFMGLLSSVKEMINSLLLINPVKSLVKHSKARNFDPARSYVRLSSPDLAKKGGGCRVKRIELKDNWDKLVSGEPNSSYGNEYDYTTTDNAYGNVRISSGVANYEPQIGGDENPFKGIMNYKIKKGSNFPKNEPILDMQFTPLGETFYPVPVVGYSKVTARSIHAAYAYSAQAYVQHEFYTARDFPVRLKESSLDFNTKWKPYLVRNENSWYGTQAYSLILNDMHGKPKRIINYAKKNPNSNTQDLISSIEYKYQTDANNNLDNNVKTLSYNNSTGLYEVVTMPLGQEIDLTTDSRYSRQRSFTCGAEINVNIEIPPFVVVPTAFPILKWDIKKFASYVTTKLVQQYGVLKETIITTDKAVNTTRNEIYNPETGQAIVKSYNNEFGDREYETNYPAAWAYKGMSATSNNLFYNGSFDSVNVNNCRIGTIVLSSEQSKTLCPGDEIILTFASGLSPFKVWLGDIRDSSNTSNGHDNRICYANVYPRDPSAATWNTNTKYTQVGFSVSKSGRKNLLEDVIQQSVSMANPVHGTTVKFTPDSLLSLSSTTYDNKNVIAKDLSCKNPFIVGYSGNYRMSNSYVYYKERDYAGHARSEGKFALASGDNFWNPQTGVCNLALVPNISNARWKKLQNEIWYSPWGAEIENKNALNITSSAQFGFGHKLPTAVASNSEHNTFMYEGFEDYNALYPMNSIYSTLLNFNYSPFKESTYTSMQAITGQSPYTQYAFGTGSGMSLDYTKSHTGKVSMHTTSAISMNLTIAPTTSVSVNNDKFYLTQNSNYIFSLWAKGISSTLPSIQAGSSTVNMIAKTNEIDGWIKYECSVNTGSGSAATLHLPSSVNIDDVRMFPAKSNMKAFVYNDLNYRLMASLDENNFATLYEYDNEGTLLRTKKETEKGVLTLQENRSSTKK